MEKSIVDAGTCRKRLTLTFSTAEVAAAFDESYREIDNYVQMKGFRKGKAPRRLLEKKFSGEAAGAAAEHLSEKNIEQAIQESGLKIMGPIEKTRGAERAVPGEPYVLELEFDVRPEFDLPEYRGLELAPADLKIEESTVDDRLEHFRTMFAHYHDVEDGAEKGDVVNVDFRAEVEGREIMNMEDKNLRVDGERLFGLPYPDLVGKFQGVKVGDAVDLEVALPEDHPDQDLRDKTAQVRLNVKKVERPHLPDLDDAFAGNLGMGTLDEFRQRIRGSLAQDAMVAARTRQEQEVIDKLIEATSFPIPEKYAKSAEESFLEQRRVELTGQGVPDDRAAELMKEAEDVADQRAERQVRWEVIAAAIADKEELKVSNEELSEHIEALARSYKTTAAKIIQRVREINGLGAMMREILDIKVMQLILDAAKGGRDDPEGPSAETEKANAQAADSVNGAGGDNEQLTIDN